MSNDGIVSVSCMPDLDTQLNVRPIPNCPGRIAVSIGALTVHVGADIADRLAALFTEAAAMAREEAVAVAS